MIETGASTNADEQTRIVVDEITTATPDAGVGKVVGVLTDLRSENREAKAGASDAKALRQ